MIEPMRKIAVVYAEPHREELLQTLQQFGKCHLEGLEQIAESELLLRRLNSLEQALHLLKTLRKSHRKRVDAKPFTGSADVWLNNLLHRTAQIQDIHQQKKVLEAMLHDCRAWGNTNPTMLVALQEAGVELTLYSCSKEEKARLNSTLLASLYPVYEEGSQEYFLALDAITLQDSTLRLLRKIPPPTLSKEQLENQWEVLDAEEKAYQSELNTGMHYVRYVRNSLAEVKDQIRYLQAIEHTQNEHQNGIFRLILWVPKTELEHLQHTLLALPVLLLPMRPEGMYEVPILLRHSALAKLFQPITKLFSLPNYGELDPTVFFAPFFTLYFGLCGSDIGYGLVLACSAALVWFFSKENSVRSFAQLGVLLGAAVMVAGVASGTFFGLVLYTLPAFDGMQKWAVLADMSSAFSFALAVGFIQLCTGYVLRMLNRWRQLGIHGVAQPAGYLLVVLGFATWLMVPLGEGFSPAAVPLGRWIGALVEAYPYLPIGMIGPGLILLLLLGNPSVPFSRRPLLGLWDIYSLATGVPTDILSYLRLFALGLSGALLGSAVNMVSFGLYQNTIWSSIAACLVWLIGHSINFALVLLSAFVHPLRLTFVEFYKSMDFKGGGLAYSPFKKNTPKPYTTHGNSPLSTLHDGPG